MSNDRDEFMANFIFGTAFVFLVGFMMYSEFYEPCASFYGDLKFLMGVPVRCIQVKP